MAHADTVRSRPSGFLTFVWALFFFFVFALIVMIWVRGSGPRQGFDDKRAEARRTKLAELQKADAAKLTAVGWVDQAKGVVRIPISDAKRLVVAELSSKKPVVSQVKVEPPLPMPPPPDPNATEPPPPALPSSPQGADTLRFDLPAAGAAVPAATPSPVAGGQAGTASPSGAAAAAAPNPPQPVAPLPATPGAKGTTPVANPSSPQPSGTSPPPAPARPPLINSTNPQ